MPADIRTSNGEGLSPSERLAAIERQHKLGIGAFVALGVLGTAASLLVAYWTKTNARRDFEILESDLTRLRIAVAEVPGVVERYEALKPGSFFGLDPIGRRAWNANRPIEAVPAPIARLLARPMGR